MAHDDFIKMFFGYDPFEVTRALTDSFPPINIYKDGNTTVIEAAVAGFTKQGLDVITEGNQLIISGVRDSAPTERKYIHRGIASREFKKIFTLSADMVVKEADLENGLLIVKIESKQPESARKRLTIK